MRRSLARGPRAVILLAIGGAILSPPAHGVPPRARASQVERLLDQWRFEDAEQLLAPLLATHGSWHRVLALHGQILFLRGEYAEAHKTLKEAVRKHRTSLQLKAWRDLVDNTASTVKGYAKQRSAAGHFEIWAPRGKDEILIPFAGETLERIHSALQLDLGYTPPPPVRVEIYPSVETLAAVSPLTIDEIKRSGTIALCKYNRLMIVSPRSLPRGYGWRDALAHEYVHFVVTRLSHNSVPIWLHEGLGKNFEARWRQPPGQNSPLSPAEEHLLASALRKGKLIPWPAMHPSMAKLPDQESTALAFAQVQTAVQYLAQRVETSGLRKIIQMIREGRSSWEAVGRVAGLTQLQFTKEWKRQLQSRNLRLYPDLVPPELRFGEPLTQEQRLAAVKQGRARRLLRIAELLRDRRLTRAAIIEYEKARAVLGTRDDLVANQLARAYLEVASPDQAISALMPVLEYYPELPGPQVTMGLAYLRKGDAAMAEKHLKVALRINPFNPDIHCNLARALKNRGTKEALMHASICTKLR